MGLLAILHWLIPLAHADIEQLGATDPGVNVMWQVICGTLPFCGGGSLTILGLACKVARFIWMTIGAVAVCFIIYAGIKIVISQGDEGAIGEGKKIVTHAVIGLVLALLAGAAINLLIALAGMALGAGFEASLMCL